MARSRSALPESAAPAGATMRRPPTVHAKASAMLSTPAYAAPAGSRPAEAG